MKRVLFILSAMMSFAAPAIAADDEKVTHRFAAAIKGKVAVIDKDGKIEWEAASGKWVPHDLQVLENGNILFTKEANLIVELNKKGQTVWEYRSKPSGDYKGAVEVHGIQPLADGNTMIAETGNKRIIEVDKSGKIVAEVPLTVDNPNSHRDTRLVRKLENGNYLVCHEGDGAVREYDKTGKVVWSYKLDLAGRDRTPGHDGHGTEVYGAVRLANGNTLIAGGNNNRVIEVDKDGKIVWKIDHDELPNIKLYWVTSLHVLPNGNVVIGNTHAGKDNPQLIEVTRDKKVVWTFSNFDLTGNDLCAVQLLDVKGKVIR
jgi:outer membrane protein assembly factor BamB